MEVQIKTEFVDSPSDCTSVFDVNSSSAVLEDFTKEIKPTIKMEVLDSPSPITVQRPRPLFGSVFQEPFGCTFNRHYQYSRWAFRNKKRDEKLKECIIDCSNPCGDQIMDITDLEKFLLERIKVDTANFGNSVYLKSNNQRNNIHVRSCTPFYKRHLKKKVVEYLRKKHLLDWSVIHSANNKYTLIKNRKTTYETVPRWSSIPTLEPKVKSKLLPPENANGQQTEMGTNSMAIVQDDLVQDIKVEEINFSTDITVPTPNSSSVKDETDILPYKMVLDCTLACKENLLVADDFEKYLNEEVKIGRKTDDSVILKRDDMKIILFSKNPFPKRYVKKRMRKFMRGNLMGLFSFCSCGKDSYELRSLQKTVPRLALKMESEVGNEADDFNIVEKNDQKLQPKSETAVQSVSTKSKRPRSPSSEPKIERMMETNLKLDLKIEYGSNSEEDPSRSKSNKCRLVTH